MKVSNFSVIKWILLLTVVFLSACAGFGDGETAVLPPTPTIASPTSVPTETATRTPSPTRPPEETAIIPTQVPTVAPTATVTPTPLPTLPPNEAIAKVLSLLQDNQNPDCLLPCWWGAAPGQTQWQNIEPHLKSFAIKIEESPKGALVKIPLPSSVAEHGFSYVGYGRDENGIIRGISIHSMNIAGYDPKTMMSLYGVPDEVWMKTFDDNLPEGVLPFQLIMIYQEQGISFHYYVGAFRIDDTVTVCFEPGIVEAHRPDLFPVGPQIRLWEPGQYRTVNEITNVSDETYYPLAEKTDLTPQTFYEKFTDPNESPCIDTPSDFWDY